MNRELINRSMEYILQHFDEDLSVKDVAEYFHYSEYYFCRSFKAATGESVYEFIMRLKMDQSAVDLKLIPDRPITDVGLDYGYSSSNYSSAFKKHHSISPSEFRKLANPSVMENPFYPEGASGFDTFDGYADRTEIRELEDLSVVYERVIGSYMDLKENWPRFVSKYKGFIKKDTLFIERFYDDPAIASLNRCICDLCMTVDKSFAQENRTTIKGGKYAVYHYEGMIQDIFCSVQGVFSVWLPASGYTMDQRYGLNIYQKMEENSECVTMDLCIPIK